MKELIVFSNHTHSFSRTIAEKYDYTAALVLGYIGFRIGLSSNEREGKRWFYDTLDEITKHYPYLGRSAVYEAIKRLTRKGGPLIVGHFNKRNGDRTNWYAFRDEDTADLLKKKPVYFKVQDAYNYGVPAAILLNNLAYHINQKRKNNPNHRFEALSATSLAQVLPFSRSTIQRALKLLVEEGLLLYRTTTDTTKPTEYCFSQIVGFEDYLAGSNPNKSIIEEVAVNEGFPGVKPAQNRIQQMDGSKPNSAGSNPNEAGSKPNDYTTLIKPFGNTVWKDCLKENETRFASSHCFPHSHSLLDRYQAIDRTIISAKRLTYI